MQIITNPGQFQSMALGFRFSGLNTALVPTMGYLHAGHKSLLLAARNQAEKVMLSIFLNPTQFGPNEDLNSYPRSFQADCEMAEKAGVDVIFAPKPEAMYTNDHATWVEVPPLAKTLCGKSRPVHFKGVCTVVLKLFALSMPSLAFFGEKDWQQLAIIKTMVRDLNFPVKIEGCPIVRESDGLALSSRNAYLTKTEREQAPYIFKGLKLAQKLVKAGEHSPHKIRTQIKNYWQENLPLGELDYLDFVDPEKMNKVKKIEQDTLLATAVRMGKARLIDNLLIRA